MYCIYGTNQFASFLSFKEVLTGVLVTFKKAHAGSGNTQTSLYVNCGMFCSVSSVTVAVMLISVAVMLTSFLLNKNFVQCQTNC